MDIAAAIAHEVRSGVKLPHEITLQAVAASCADISLSTVARRLKEMEAAGKITSRLVLHEGAEQRVYAWVGPLPSADDLAQTFRPKTKRGRR